MTQTSSGDANRNGCRADAARPLQEVAVHLHGRDQVAIARCSLTPGTLITLDGQGGEGRILVRQTVPAGHKLALADIASGEPVRRYGQIIGFATREIRAGEHVHMHNLGVQGFDRCWAFGTKVRPVAPVPAAESRTFLGYARADGRVGTRNYVAVIATVNCAAHVCREIARYFTPERLAPYVNVDGVVAVIHSGGCGGQSQELFQRTLAGVASHPNVGAALLVGLGCETNQLCDLVRRPLPGGGCLAARPDLAPTLLIQEAGGIGRSVRAGITQVEQSLLPIANRSRRSRQSISELTVALQCGGSDGWSGVTANPLVGLVADEIVCQGGTVVLAETPEVHGAEHLLTSRAANREVGEQLLSLSRWWEDYLRKFGVEFDSNAGPGNRAGGITTIYEKALGAIAKGGHTPLNAVYHYAEPVTSRGLVFMDSPGYDPVAVTGQVAAGCNLVLFTTGRGSVYGCRLAPTLKICSNSATFAQMSEDMDVNAGRALEGVPLDSLAAELLDLVVEVASGRPTKSEAQNVGEAEFCPWEQGGLT